MLAAFLAFASARGAVAQQPPKDQGAVPGTRPTVTQPSPGPSAGDPSLQDHLLVFTVRTSLSNTAIPQSRSAIATVPGTPAPQTPAAPAPKAQAAPSAPGQKSAAAPPPQAGGNTPATIQLQTSQANDWGQTLIRTTLPGIPIDIRLVGDTMVTLIQVVPFESGKSGITLVVQGQVWLKMPDGSLSYQTTLKTLAVAYGERLLFYPLGIDAKTGAPVTVEIVVDKANR